MLVYTETVPPPPQGECRIRDILERPLAAYDHLVYVVHPSVVENSSAGVVQGRVQELVDSYGQDERVVLIAPPQRCVYLRPGSEVTDIRCDRQEYRWALDNDYPDSVRQITLIGGNLERCLGAVAGDIQSQLSLLKESGKVSREVLEFNLPLDAIYTVSGDTADSVLRSLMSKGNALEAIVALLTTNNPINGYGEFEVISSHTGLGEYELCLDGESVGTLRQPNSDSRPGEAFTDGFGLEWIQVVTPDPILYKINLTTGEDRGGNLNIIDDFLEAKLRHARDVVIPRYRVDL